MRKTRNTESYNKTPNDHLHFNDKQAYSGPLSNRITAMPVHVSIQLVDCNIHYDKKKRQNSNIILLIYLTRIINKYHRLCKRKYTDAVLLKQCLFLIV